MNQAYFCPLVAAPIIITGTGEYRTRSGEIVTVTKATIDHEFGCVGRYQSGALDAWHRSGRLLAGALSDNDIVSALPKTYRHYGMDFAIVAEYPDTEEGTSSANRFMAMHRNTGLLAVGNGRVIIAALGDKGQKAA